MRWKLIAAVLMVMCGVVAFFMWREDSSTRTLLDGSTLVLSGVRIGHTNVYTHGNFLSKTVGRFVPSNGLAIAGYKVQRPTRLMLYDWYSATQLVEVLTAQVRLIPRSAQADDFLKPPFYRKFRLLILGDDGFTYVQEFDAFKQYDDGLFRHINARTFPRTSRTIRFRLEERDDAGTRKFREVATFTVKNPKPTGVEKWSVEQSPRIKLAADLEVQIGELVVRSDPIHASDIWDHIADLSYRVTSAGQMLTNWAIHQSRIRDASGNFDPFLGNIRTTNDWTVYRSHYVVDPRYPWRFDVNFALDSGFPTTNLFRFTIPYPMAGAAQTNFAGLPVSITYVNTDMLAVELLTRPPDTRLTFVSAKDDDGNYLNDVSGSWSQHSFWKLLKVRSSKGMNVHATVAIHPNYPATFTLQPWYETKIKGPD